MIGCLFCELTQASCGLCPTCQPANNLMCMTAGSLRSERVEVELGKPSDSETLQENMSACSISCFPHAYGPVEDANIWIYKPFSCIMVVFLLYSFMIKTFQKVRPSRACLSQVRKSGSTITHYSLKSN